MTLPSVEKIQLITGDKEIAVKVRKRLERYRQAGLTSPRNCMMDINDYIGGHGVEYIGRGTNSKSPAIQYVNMGDTYATTLLYVNGNFRVGCWGDIVEKGSYT